MDIISYDEMLESVNNRYRENKFNNMYTDLIVLWRIGENRL